MEEGAYRTVRGYGMEEFIINKSRFLGHARPAASQEEAQAFLSEMRLKYKDASHNCFAYVIGQNAGIQRYSDDGEPSGTAGLPIIEVVKAQNVVNVCVVVTRYFGGVLLGAAGLVRAYTQGAVSALRAAQVVTMHRTQRYLFDLDYPLLGRVDHWLEGQPVRLESRDFGACVTLGVAVKNADAPAFLRGLSEVTQGKAEPLLAEEGYDGWEV